MSTAPARPAPPSGIERPPTEVARSPALRPPPGNPRFPLLDSMRAIAALSVLVYHVGFWGHLQQTHSYGAVLTSLGFGVAVFFVLSGFLLYRPFFNAEVTGSPRPRIRQFLRRRAVRVVPAYWLALTVLAIFPGLTGVFTDHWWRYYFFLQIYSSVPLIRITGISVAWSLCIEVSFYIALPFYAALTRRFARSLDPDRKALAQLAILTVLGGASLILGYGIHGADTPPLLLTFFDWFALGMGLAVVSVWAHERQTQPWPIRFITDHPGWCWGAALIVYAILSALVASAPQHYIFSRSQAFEDHALRGLVAFLLVLPAVFGDHAGGWPRRLLGHGWMRWLGLISYGIFLWHLPLLLWMYRHGVHFAPLLLVCTVAVTIACAAASYYLVERPLLRFKDPGPRRGAQGAHRPAPAARPSGESPAA
jgi:peptidoglycan/LPS O-acetylase OafA/YrhL